MDRLLIVTEGRDQMTVVRLQLVLKLRAKLGQDGQHLVQEIITEEGVLLGTEHGVCQ